MHINQKYNDYISISYNYSLNVREFMIYSIPHQYS